jgi:predicted metal-dependent phosphoesterase TrpH
MRLPRHPHADEVLVDPHAHTMFSDGLSTPRRMFLRARKQGLHGLVLTDHDTLRHWEPSLAAARRLRMPTALGVELSTAGGHLLAYFPCDTPPRRVARALRLDEGTIHYLDPRSAIRRVHELGGLACVPHPFGPFYPLGAELFDLVDGVEEYNSWIYRDTPRFHNAFGAGARHRIAALGASDSHYPFTVGFGATAVPAAIDFSKPDWFLHCIRQRLTRPIVLQRPIHRRINYLKFAVSLPLNVRYNARFFRAKWRGYWRQRYREMISRGP